MIVNAARGLASEFGLTAPQGISKMDELKASVEGDDDLPDAARSVLNTLFQQLASLSKQIEALEERIVLHAKTNETARRLATIPGVGPTTSSLLAATIADISVFPSARHFAAWLGLVPRQFSTGGKTRLGRITKAGNTEIRRLLVLGATSMVRRAEHWRSALGQWVRSALGRRPTRLVTVALANKMARIAWALMSHNEIYRPTRNMSAAT
jgi:error-prone DNA polymerase